MQEPSQVILPDGTVITRDSEHSTLEQVRAHILKKRWASQEDDYPDAANVVLYRWLCGKHGSHQDWDFEEPGIGPPIQLREIRPTRMNITGDRGLLCIIDPDAYVRSGEEWNEFEYNLFEHISLQRALACDLGHGANWATEVTTQRATTRAFMSATGPIICSNGRLTICGAEALYFYCPEVSHMHLVGLEFDITPGPYDCTILQIRPPDYLHPEFENWKAQREVEDSDIVIQLTPRKKPSLRGATGIFWIDESRHLAKARGYSPITPC